MTRSTITLWITLAALAPSGCSCGGGDDGDETEPTAAPEAPPEAEAPEAPVAVAPVLPVRVRPAEGEGGDEAATTREGPFPEPPGEATEIVAEGDAPAPPAEATDADETPSTPEPSRAVAAAPSTPVLHEVDGLSLGRLQLATAIEDREPVSPGTAFTTTDERIFAFLQLRNDGDAERTVVVTFERPDGARVGNATLAVPGHQPRWRTWASTRHVRQAGRWTAHVETEDGEPVGTLAFTVSRGGPGV